MFQCPYRIGLGVHGWWCTGKVARGGYSYDRTPLLRQQKCRNDEVTDAYSCSRRSARFRLPYLGKVGFQSFRSSGGRSGGLSRQCAARPFRAGDSPNERVARRHITTITPTIAPRCTALHCWARARASSIVVFCIRRVALYPEVQELRQELPAKTRTGGSGQLSIATYSYLPRPMQSLVPAGNDDGTRRWLRRAFALA